MKDGFLRALARLFMVQGSWNYERMTGVGMGYAAEPLLEDLKSVDPARHAEASVRSAEYFNSHPYLAGLALGALARAEYDQVPAPQVARLRAALTSPLGALGDQFFWVGLMPATMALAIICVVGGAGVEAIVALVVAYNLARIATGVWALRTGLDSGTRVGHAIAESWLPREAPRAGLAAALCVGIALPIAMRWLLPTERAVDLWVATASVLVALLVSWKAGPKGSSLRFSIWAILLAVVFVWGFR
ncbi:MAG TPA: PTS system mannose/fructose/sorbose family transporter subunit IID [Gemmatimonadales bacterium]|nr:PTS system mannose/fructose/sorbose family transporter subunit IID [Gemmatimonadales bacterium]